MSDAPREALERARAALLRELAAVAETAAHGALTRCPYRDARDRCTFQHGCRNQRQRPEPGRYCAGGPLNPLPAVCARS